MSKIYQLRGSEIVEIDAFAAAVAAATINGLEEKFWREALPTPNKTEITIPKGLYVNIDGIVYTSVVDTTLQLSEVATADARKGLDVYIYACKPVTGSAPYFLLSMNSTVPDTYTAETSRKIGGFHCLSADVGTIENHPLSDYVAGDILPASVWDLLHRPYSEPEGMVYSEELNLWCDIYLASWDGSKLVSINGATTVDGTSAKPMHGEAFVENFAKVKKRLPFRNEFQVIAKGSNEGTAINGAADAGSTGTGHVDTAGRRMISNIGCEDCCGFLWQWTGDIWNANGTTWTSINVAAIDGTGVTYGQMYGTLHRFIVGGAWDNAAKCGSRCVAGHHSSVVVHAAFGARGFAEPR